MSFQVWNELYGDGGADAQWMLDNGLADGFTFHPPLSSGERAVGVKSYFAIPQEAGIPEDCYPYGVDPNAAQVCTETGAYRMLMPEFDQGGGCWATGRPNATGRTDQQAYDDFLSYYRVTKGLAPYLAQTGYKTQAASVFAFSTQYAYDMGADCVMLERNIDEVSGMTPGLAMLRGAARQHGNKPWGIDISTWRYWNEGPTEFFPDGALKTGWSTSTFWRHYFMVYMGGARIMQNEAAVFNNGQTLNPLGQTLQRFMDFVRRHPRIGTPYVPIALVHPHLSGFEPRFGAWMQGPRKWYWHQPYTAADQQFADCLAMAYPGYENWGKPIGPWVEGAGPDVAASVANYRQRLVNREDPRPWEIFGTTRWGETFDVITDRASATARGRYKALVTDASQLPALADQHAKVIVDGAPLTYLVNTRKRTRIVTLVNTNLDGSVWEGSLRFTDLPAGSKAREWVMDQPVDMKGSTLQAVVPPYGVRVYAAGRDPS